MRPTAFLEAALAWHEQVLEHGEISAGVRAKLQKAAAVVRASRMKPEETTPAVSSTELRAPRTKLERAEASARLVEVRAPRTKPHADASSLGAAEVRALRTKPDADVSSLVAAKVRAPRTKRDATLLPAPAELVPGTRLVKIHGGQTHVVEVTTCGMLYHEQLYSSLSAVAKVITGTHWNGLLFFGLRKRKTYPKVAPNG
jgi:hypothetical protein